MLSQIVNFLLIFFFYIILTNIVQEDLGGLQCTYVLSLARDPRASYTILILFSFSFFKGLLANLNGKLFV